jgi:hypothetical protein
MIMKQIGELYFEFGRWSIEQIEFAKIVFMLLFRLLNVSCWPYEVCIYLLSFKNWHLFDDVYGRTESIKIFDPVAHVLCFGCHENYPIVGIHYMFNLHWSHTRVTNKCFYVNLVSFKLMLFDFLFCLMSSMRPNFILDIDSHI